MEVMMEEDKPAICEKLEVAFYGMTREELHRVFNEATNGGVEDCHMGTPGYSLPWVRFKTVMAAEAAMAALREKEIHMEDKSKHGEDRWPILAGERRQDRNWFVPALAPGSTPAGARQPIRDDDDSAEQPQPHAFGVWWTEEEEREETPEEEPYSTGGWDQWQDTEEQRRQPTLWEEARARDHHDHTKAFTETVPYHAWLEEHAIAEEIGDAREWVCFVCKRGNLLDLTECSVCGSARDYQNQAKLRRVKPVDLRDAAKPRRVLPDDLREGGAIKKRPDARVVFKKDAWHRNVYEIKP